MVFVEHTPCLLNVYFLLRRIFPRQLRQPFQVCAKHRAFRAALAHALQALELLDGLLVHRLGHAGGLDRLFQHLDLALAVLALAELLLDLALLLAQHVLALALVELLLSLVADLLGDAQHPDALAEQRQNLVQAPPEVEGLQEVLLVLVLHVEQVRHQVGEHARRGDAVDHHGELLGGVRQQLDRLGRLLLELQEARLDFRRQRVVRFYVLHARDEVGPALEELEHAEARLALHHEVVRAFGAGDVAHHLAGGADPVQVLGLDPVLLRVALQEEADPALGAHRFLRGGDRDRAPERDRRDHPREQHRVSHRDEDQPVFRDGLLGHGGYMGRQAAESSPQGNPPDPESYI